ncbi:MULTISPECIES: hypothetical protein [unclassified Brucella]|uniref:hypothetical protein n=1 Tax=unclassified Brucella TaxID=2632610 RepID=UPI0012ADBB20|nr:MULTISPECIES: hypothetical protein [unclassified Brucella]MRN42759.1 hypothetical protein [Brucella sp. 09RB8913]MRN58059.1 hypothetical protein [Brucella sp. 09RB8918]CAB4327288.1 transthyretin-like protein [Brucella sp. 191011898]
MGQEQNGYGRLRMHIPGQASGKPAANPYMELHPIGKRQAENLEEAPIREARHRSVAFRNSVHLRFGICGGKAHYRLPRLVSPFSCSTCWGS